MHLALSAPLASSMGRLGVRQNPEASRSVIITAGPPASSLLDTVGADDGAHLGGSCAIVFGRKRLGRPKSPGQVRPSNPVRLV